MAEAQNLSTQDYKSEPINEHVNEVSVGQSSTEKCPLCSKELRRYDLCSIDEYSLCSCLDCGSLFFNPPIDRNFIDNFYSELDFEAVHAVGYKNTIEKYKKLFKNIFPNSKGKTLLSVESTQGYALEAAKSLGFSSLKGIDRYDFYTSFQKENFGEKFFEAISLNDYAEENREKVDVVLSIEAISKEPNADKYIANIAKVIKDGGTLYIEEVDGNSYFLPADLSRWTYIQPPVICNLISKKALYALLNKHGFKVKKKLWSFGYTLKIIAVKVKN